MWLSLPGRRRCFHAERTLEYPDGGREVVDAPGGSEGSDDDAGGGHEIVGEGVRAGEIEIDQARDLVAEKEHIVRKQIGMDHAVRQILRPMAFEMAQLLLHHAPGLLG